MSKVAVAAIAPASDLWPRHDGSLLACREKLRVLRENHGEMEQMFRDCFDDAVLMGVDAYAMRHLLHRMVDALRDPRDRGPTSP